MSDKNAVFERLNKRDAQRLEKIHKAHKAKEEVDAVSESVNYFEEAFKEKAANIEDGFAQTANLDASELPNHLNGLKKDIAELNKFLISSSLFLKEFNMRKFLGIIQSMQTKCYDLEEKYVPRKKFGFTKKKLAKTNLSPCAYSGVNDLVSNKNKQNTWDVNLFGFDSKENEILILEQEDIYQRDVTLSNLKQCTVGLKGVLGTLHMSNIDNCIILTGPISTSVFVDKCVDSKIVTACQQLRMHSSTNCDIYLHVTSKGIIEDCSHIRTAPYNLKYEGLDSHFNMSPLDRNVNNWDKLDDFNWLSIDVPSPNWAIKDESKIIQDWSEWWTRTPI